MAMAAVTACSSTPFARAICSKKTILQLSSRQGELAGGSRAVFWPPSVCISAAPRIAIRPIQPVASRRCPLTGKKANNGYKVSFSHHRTKHLQHVNLQYKRLWWEAGKRFVKLRISTKALKTIDRKGLDVMAKEAGIDLHKC